MKQSWLCYSLHNMYCWSLLSFCTSDSGKYIWCWLNFLIPEVRPVTLHLRFWSVENPTTTVLTGSVLVVLFINFLLGKYQRRLTVFYSKFNTTCYVASILSWWVCVISKRWSIYLKRLTILILISRDETNWIFEWSAMISLFLS